MHVHAGVVDFLTTGAYILIFLFFARQVAAWRAETPFGKGLGAIVG